MPKLKLNDTVIRNLKPTDKLVAYGFEGHKGLFLRVTPAGVKTFVMIYRSRITGQTENEKIGRYPEVSLADAVARIHDAWKDAAASKPVAFTEAKKNGKTVDDVFADYKQRRLCTLRSEYEIGINLTAVIERNRWGALPVTSLTKTMIRDALNHYVDVREAPQAALLTQKRMNAWLRWAVKRDYIPFNPLAGGVLDVEEGKPRERTLDANELRKLWKACENPAAFGLRESYARALQLMLVTGARSGMVCGMVEGELDLRGDNGPVWDLPGERMKTGVPFVCPLNALAVALIKRRDPDCPFVCPTTSKFIKDRNRLPLHGRQLSYVVQGLCKTLAIPAFTPHDLRRTASELLCREYDENVVGLLLAHENSRGVMKHYNPQNRWKKLAIKREMSDKLAAILKGIVGDNVVRLREVA